MKVLLSVYACEPNRGSEYGFGWNWAVHLAKQGHKIWVVTAPDAREAIEQATRENPVHNLHIDYVDIPAHYKPVMKGIFGAYAHYFLWQRSAYLYAKKLLGGQKFDLVHHVTWGSLIGGSWLWKLDAPFIFGPVGGGQVAPKAFKRYFPTRWRQESFRTFVTEKMLPGLPFTIRMLKHTELLLATNRDTLKLAKLMGVKKAELFLDSGLPDHYFAGEPKAGFGSDKIKILWVGRILERKALRLSLEAVSKLKFPFSMTIVGEGYDDASVNDWIKELGLSEKVEWKGRITWDAVQRTYEEHDVFLFTSLRDSFGSQLLEAMSNGLAIVTLDHHGARDFVPNNAGIRVNVTTPEETIDGLARALTALHEQPHWFPIMSKTGLEFARQNNWTNRAREMTTIYQSVVKHASRNPHF